MMMSFQKIYDQVKDYEDVEIMTADQIRQLHIMNHGYLKEFISKSKKDVNGADYANLVHILYSAQQ